MKQTRITSSIEAAAEVAALRELCHTRRKRRYRRSRLEEHRAELVALQKAGATVTELQLWLRRSCRVKVARSTVWRYLQQLPELREV